MALEIKESDWKLFRQLHQVALERFCERVLAEVRAATAETGDTYHDMTERTHAEPSIKQHRPWVARLGTIAAWVWAILAAGGGAMLL